MEVCLSAHFVSRTLRKMADRKWVGTLFPRRISGGVFKVPASEGGHSVKNMDANLDLYFLILEVACL